MTEVSSEQMNAIVSDGIAFLRSITMAYGSETGMELWDTIATTLDPSIKGKIFFSMLTDSHEDRVTVTGAANGANKIMCIKLIRQYTGLGLTEAKNAYEAPVDYRQPTVLKVNPKDRRNMIDDLRQNGMIVS
jgi:ribosomal protein L7/L12